jgi:hypothetical protein
MNDEVAKHVVPTILITRALGDGNSGNLHDGFDYALSGYQHVADLKPVWASIVSAKLPGTHHLMSNYEWASK